MRQQLSLIFLSLLLPACSSDGTFRPPEASTPDTGSHTYDGMPGLPDGCR